jgi:hypothetical protein
MFQGPATFRPEAKFWDELKREKNRLLELSRNQVWNLKQIFTLRPYGKFNNALEELGYK